MRSTELATPTQLPEEVKKAVWAIHCSGNLTGTERKIWNNLLLHAYDDLLTRDEHVISVKLLLALLKSKTHNREFIGKALIALRAKTVEFNLLQDQVDPDTPKGRKPWTLTGLLSEGFLDGGELRYSFGERMRKKLYEPDIFALINMRVEADVKSDYALALYENCVRFTKTGSTGWWDVDIFRTLVGAKAPTYDNFKRLSLKVIGPAMKEVSKKTDISLKVEYEYGRGRGRPVERLRFKVERNAQVPLFGLSEDLDHLRSLPVYKRLTKLGVGGRLALTLACDLPYAEKLAELMDNKSARKEITNPGGFARYMVAGGHAVDGVSPKSVREAGSKRARKEATLAEQPAEAEKAARIMVDSLKPRDELRLQFAIERVRSYLAGLSGAELKGLLRTWAADAGAASSAEMEYDPLIKGKSARPAHYYRFENYVQDRILATGTDKELQLWLDRRAGYRSDE